MKLIHLLTEARSDYIIKAQGQKLANQAAKELGGQNMSGEQVVNQLTLLVNTYIRGLHLNL